MRILRRALASGLSLAPATVRADLFSFLARKLKINFIVADGGHGPFEGALKDKIIFGEYLRTRTYGKHIISLFQDFFARNGGGTFVDIGANIGLVSIPISRTPGVRCIALEPDPVNYGCLLRNIQRNGQDLVVTPVNQAVFRVKDVLTFELSDTNWGDHRIRIEGVGGEEAYNQSARQTIRVEAAPLDDLVAADATGPIAIKIDIQGAEIAAFQGGPRVLGDAAMMVSEFWPYAISRAGGSAEEFLAALEPHFAFGINIGHRTGAAELLNMLRRTPLMPFAQLRSELLRLEIEMPKIYTDILLCKRRDLFLQDV